MSKSPIISVLIPAHNEEHHIRRAIISILCQEFTDFEVIVIDDASDDCTSKVVKTISDSRLQFIQNEVNRGVVNCLNRGLELARGSFVARMDADDVSLRTRLSRQVALMRKDPLIVAAGTGVFFIDYSQNEFRRMIPVCEDIRIKKELVTHNPINTGSVMYRMSALQRIGGFACTTPEEQMVEGYSTLLRLANHGNFCNLPSAEYVYFIYGSETNRSLADGYRKRNLAMSKIVSQNQQNLSGKTTFSLFRQFLSSSLWSIYHFLPRKMQVVMRRYASDRTYVPLEAEEIRRIESLCETFSVSNADLARFPSI